MATDVEEVKKSVRIYLNVFGALMVLTVLTVAVSYVDFGIPLAITVALIIACVKGSLVASYFMHLIAEQKTIYWTLLLTVAFFAVLMFLPILTASDTIGR